ncbi:MAG: hypothetical protein ABI923_04415 [bacterium]
MFIATDCTRKDLAPLGAKPGNGTIGELAKAIALPELRSKEGTSAINISPLWGEATP